ncbi:unnamed protein product [Moneuplotes crassus]|uniref:Uncharacterized protein n=1 Tax=Euplotes crassus TaxID=5936 RepID=A0AAD1Y9N4_EUPCR|nr:unnamed protein product [Moneuplotes crassus]
MSDYSEGEGELSERSDSGCETDNSPRFGEEDDQGEDQPGNGMMDLRTTEFRNDDFELPQDDYEEMDEKKTPQKESKTFYNDDKLNPFQRNSSLEHEKHKNSNEKVKYEQRSQQSPYSHAKGRNSDASKGNDELKFILSHSNTLLTSEIPEDARNKQARNIIDIDEDSNEQYEDFEDHLHYIRSQVDSLKSSFKVESERRNNEMTDLKSNIENVNEKVDKILSLLTCTKNEADFSKYRTNTFINTSTPKMLHQRSSNDFSRPKARNVQAFDDSEALLNNMVESQLKREEIKKKEDEKPKLDPVQYIKPEVEERDSHHEDKEKEQTQPEDDLQIEDIQSSDSNNDSKSSGPEGEESEEDLQEDSEDEISDKEQNKKEKENENIENSPKSSKGPREVISEVIEVKPKNSTKEQEDATNDELKITMKKSDDNFCLPSPKKEPIDYNSLEIEIESNNNDVVSQSSSKRTIVESKVYDNEDDFVKSFLEEIKEESSNLTSGGTPLQTHLKVPPQVKKAQSSQTKVKRPKVLIRDSIEDPMDLLSQDFEVIDQSINHENSMVKESSQLDSTIISSGKQCLGQRFEVNQKKTPEKEKHAVPARLKSTVKKFNNTPVINLEETEDDLIDILISEEGEIQEESIIKYSENSLNKRNAIEIPKSQLVKVDPVERYKEIMKNSQKSKEGLRKGTQNKLGDYQLNNTQEEESVKLEDITVADRLQNKQKIINPQKEKDDGSKYRRNIFFGISSQKDANESEDRDLMEPDDYIEQSIQSQRNQLTPSNMNKDPNFFGKPQNKRSPKKLKKARKPIRFDDGEDDAMNIEALINAEMENMYNLG